MPKGTTTLPSQRNKNTIILPIEQEEYGHIVISPSQFRQWIHQYYVQYPELFPDNFKEGYTLHDDRTSKKLSIRLRRIKLSNGEKWSIRPSFMMPYATALTKDVEDALLLRKWSVPYWVLAKIFGKDDNYWYRIEAQFGNCNIVATTVKNVAIPQDLLADEHHEWINGEKTYIATTIAGGCVLGAEISASASTDDLKAAYGVFKSEAVSLEPNYEPKTVNTDGWIGTVAAWKALFMNIVLIRCFLHAWLRIRERSKNLQEFFDIGKQVWAVYHAKTQDLMKQELQKLRSWAMQHLSGIVLAKVLDLCNKSHEWSLWYEHSQAARTSNELDRLMRSQNDYFDRGQHFHGTLKSANRRSRAWAILHNYWDWSPVVTKKNHGCRCPAERLNNRRYATSWLQNLLVATSATTTRKKTPHNPG
jgi:hypothetical protein